MPRMLAALAAHPLSRSRRGAGAIAMQAENERFVTRSTGYYVSDARKDSRV